MKFAWKPKIKPNEQDYTLTATTTQIIQCYRQKNADETTTRRALTSSFFSLFNSIFFLLFLFVWILTLPGFFCSLKILNNTSEWWKSNKSKHFTAFTRLLIKKNFDTHVSLSLYLLFHTHLSLPRCKINDVAFVSFTHVFSLAISLTHVKSGDHHISIYNHIALITMNVKWILRLRMKQTDRECTYKHL